MSVVGRLELFELCDDVFVRFVQCRQVRRLQFRRERARLDEVSLLFGRQKVRRKGPGIQHLRPRLTDVGYVGLVHLRQRLPLDGVAIASGRGDDAIVNGAIDDCPDDLWLNPGVAALARPAMHFTGIFRRGPLAGFVALDDGLWDARLGGDGFDVRVGNQRRVDFLATKALDILCAMRPQDVFKAVLPALEVFLQLVAIIGDVEILVDVDVDAPRRRSVGEFTR